MSMPITGVVPAVDAGPSQVSTPTELPEYRLKRLVFHVTSIGPLAPLAFFLSVFTTSYIIVFFVALIFLLTPFQNRFNIFRWMLKKFQARDYEFNGRMSAIDFILGAAMAFAITFPAEREVFACVLLIVALCDPPGRVIGVMSQRGGWAVHWPKWINAKKTVWGSLAVWAAAWATACLVVSWEKALLVGLFAAIAELIPQPEFYEDEGEAKAGEWMPWYGKIQGPFDNGLIPVATALGFLLVM